MSTNGQILSRAWGEERTVSAWFTAWQPSPTGAQIQHIPVGSRIRIGSFETANVREIKMQDGGILRVRRQELEGRSNSIEDIGGATIGAGARTRAVEPGNFTTRNIDIVPFMNSLYAHGKPAEVVVTKAFVAQNMAPSSPDVPLQRGTHLLLKGYRPGDEQMALAPTEPGWNDQAYFFASLTTVSSSCLPTSAAMTEYRSPAEPPQPAIIATQNSSERIGVPVGPSNNLAQAIQDALVPANGTQAAHPVATSSQVSGPSDEIPQGVQEDDTTAQTTQPPVAAQQAHANPYVAALEALQPNGRFAQPLLTRDDLKELCNTESTWTLEELQFRLASMVNADFFQNLGAGRLSALTDPADTSQLLPVHDPLINPENKSFAPKKGRNYVITRVMSSAQGRVVHQGQNACKQCQKFASKGWGQKRYCQCVTVSDASGEEVLGGACSNCAHGDHPEICSFYTKN
ncbi:hypothetical protein PRZ48_007403 [Zasmidium cellare]|uniref:Uncharacterized protein n=1 Tax=Zasmidium cellare TaxID=395010 RepID=A0ABR0EJ91_ZASCE|nr:hypothetical protein PRZ48_007403 [Zasmidium cellare]